MRTTLDIDSVALSVLRDLAAVEGRSIGKVASDLILEAVQRRPFESNALRNGVPLMRRGRGTTVTDDLILKIREEEGV